ncbi:hypothetical protein C8R44DRAFT_992851 [Mycena epipterygia]|nr:hypothetical protein C8R44DRAFT_992851 [Mycena epipterygia]
MSGSSGTCLAIEETWAKHIRTVFENLMESTVRRKLRALDADRHTNSCLFLDIVCAWRALYHVADLHMLPRLFPLSPRLHTPSAHHLHLHLPSAEPGSFLTSRGRGVSCGRCSSGKPLPQLQYYYILPKPLRLTSAQPAACHLHSLRPCNPSRCTLPAYSPLLMPAHPKSSPVLHPHLHHTPTSPASTGVSSPCPASPSLQIPRGVYNRRVACVHDKDQDVSAKNMASDAANVVAHSHGADGDRPTVDKTQTSICPPRLGIDWSGKHPVHGGNSCAGRTLPYMDQDRAPVYADWHDVSICVD